MTALGCPDRYTVELRTRGGGTKIGALPGVTALRWARTLGETSEATIEIAPRGRACSALLDGAMGWAHEVCIWRGSEAVWEGPLIDKADTGTGVTLLARDVSAWLGKRIVHQGYDTTGLGADLATIGVGMITDAIAPDDPGILEHLWAAPAGVMAERFVDAETVMADADLAELAALGLDWTVTGRRLLLFSRAEPLYRLVALTGRHFAGPLPIIEAGAGTITRAVLQGGGVRGEAGGVHPVFGLLETLDTQTAVTSDEDAAVAAAHALYTPSLLLAGTDIALLPTAPVSIEELVPGVSTTVSGRGSACQVTGAEVQLTKLAVEWSPTGETVTPTFVELGDRTTP